MLSEFEKYASEYPTYIGVSYLNIKAVFLIRAFNSFRSLLPLDVTKQVKNKDYDLVYCLHLQGCLTAISREHE